jgi:hypothetical protein
MPVSNGTTAATAATKRTRRPPRHTTRGTVRFLTARRVVGVRRCR